MALKVGNNIRLFDNPVLERLTYVHPVTPALLWMPIITYCFFHVISAHLMAPLMALGFFIAGFFIWSLTEYSLHRFVFHHVPKNAFQERMVYLFHGIHHTDPKDQRRLLMPPVAAILIASLFYGLFILFLGTVKVMPFFSGFMAGYLCYDYIHFATHYYLLNKSWFALLKRNHMQHHFTKNHKLYGVSSPFWDHIFGTDA